MDPTGPSTGIPATDPGPVESGTYPHGHWVSDAAGVNADSHLVQEADNSHLWTDGTQWERWQSGPQANTVSRIRHDNVSADTHQWVTHRHDPCGNLTFDGEYFYQYDAWNRLVQINAAGEMIWQLFVAAGVPRPVACEDDLLLGRLVKHFIYDGVGRLVRTSSPIEAPEGFELSYTDGGVTYYVSAVNRSERFFYDGTRRIQELITDPVLVTKDEHDTVSMSDEVYQSQTGGSTALNGMYVRAQYIWGPGDGTNGVDELLCQLDPRDTSSSTYTNGGGKPWYILTDAQGDVVSVAHLPTGSNQVIEVGGQWTYTPYGEVLTYEKLHPHPAVVFGHKTLPVDRLDAPALGWDTEGEGYSAETRRLVPGARLLGYNRGRTTNFKLGRFMQGDPNAAGTTALTSMMFHGQAPSAFAVTLDVQDRTGDGINLFGYLGNNPSTRSDPTGLYLSPFDTLDIGAQAMQAASQYATQYSMTMSDNVDWALDWSAKDDEPWKPEASSDFGAENFEAASFGESGGYEGPMGYGRISRTTKAAHIITKAAKYAKTIVSLRGKVYSTYKEAKLITKGAGGALQAHHILPSWAAKQFKFLTKADNIPAIILSRRQHIKIGPQVDAAIRNLRNGASPQEVLNAIRQVYQKFAPEAIQLLNGIK